MKRTVSPLVFACLVTNCLAQDALPAPTHRNVKYGSHARHVLDFWKAESDAPSPLAIYFHGGGFTVFDKSKITTKWPQTVNALLNAKISVAAVNYRAMVLDVH